MPGLTGPAAQPHSNIKPSNLACFVTMREEYHVPASRRRILFDASDLRLSPRTIFAWHPPRAGVCMGRCAAVLAPARFHPDHRTRRKTMGTLATYAAVLFLAQAAFVPRAAFGLETLNVALTSKAFQYVPLPIAQERGYMREEGIDLKFVYMQNAPALQALIANAVQFSGSGSSALVAISKGNAPLKTVLAFSDQVLQWVVVRPGIKSLKDLTGKKVATTGVAPIAAFMFRNILIKHNIPKDIVLIDPGPVNRLPSLLSGAVDAAIVSPEERY